MTPYPDTIAGDEESRALVLTATPAQLASLARSMGNFARLHVIRGNADTSELIARRAATYGIGCIAKRLVRVA